jgi:hypothetical protein
MALGDEATVPIPWGGLLVVGVLAVGLMALGPEAASSPRTRKMRANGRRPARRTLRPEEAGERAGRAAARRLGRTFLGESGKPRADWFQEVNAEAHAKAGRVFDDPYDREAYAEAFYFGVADALDRAPRQRKRR